MARKVAWAEVVASWQKTLCLSNRQGSNSMELIGLDEERLLVDTLADTAASDLLRDSPGDAVDEALREAAASARRRRAPGDEEFSTWCDDFRRGHGKPDPLAAATMKRCVALVRPPGADEEPAFGALAIHLFDLVRDGDADARAWGVYAAGMAALALHHGWGPSRARSADSRASWAAFAWLLACVACLLIRRARSYDVADLAAR
jgi:hypothetical protein